MMSLRSICGVLLAGFFTAGCVNLEPTPDETRFFTLGSPAPGSESTSGGGRRVGVRVVSMSDYLRGSGIAVRHGAHEIKYSQGNRWASGLDDAMAQVLSDSLRRELPTLSIVAINGIRPAPPEIVLEVDVLAAEGTAEGRAVLELSWRIVGAGVDGLASVGRFAEAKSGWDRADFGQLAAMLSELAGDATVRMAVDVTEAAAALESER